MILADPRPIFIKMKKVFAVADANHVCSAPKFAFLYLEFYLQKSLNINHYNMILHISGEKTIREIQNEFHASYPFLKLEFFRHSHKAGKPSPKTDMVSPSSSVGVLMNGNKEANFEVNASKTVAALEQEFHEKFGLNVQVFRKSQTLWIETSLTDHWTLGRQNEEGEIFSHPHNTEKLDLGDRDKWE